MPQPARRGSAARAPHRPASRRRASLDPLLTARDVEEAIEERIANGLYAPGTRLPPMRNIAAEFGTSASTVSRALQEMVRDGTLEVHERRFVRVRSQLPAKAARSADVQRSVRAIAHKWKLRGGSLEDLMDTLREVVGEVFEAQGRFVFTECTQGDLDYMGRQLAEHMPDLPLSRVLIHDLGKMDFERDRPVVLVPYYHYAEVRELVGQRAPVVPLHFRPSVETLDRLLTTLKPGGHAVVFGRDERSVARLSLLVRYYVDVRISTVVAAEAGKLTRLAKTADAVVAVAAALEAAPRVPRIKNLIEVRFALESPFREGAATGEITLTAHL
jgi:DNA-binding transcriptional regulator YhcF (GntR family)